MRMTPEPLESLVLLVDRTNVTQMDNGSQFISLVLQPFF